MKNNEIIPLADSSTLRFIDYLNGLESTEYDVQKIKKEIKYLKKSTNPSKKEIKELYEKLNEIQFKPDYLCLIIDKESDYWKLYKKGFKINGIKYKRLLATTGGVKGSTIVFTSERLHEKLRNRIDNGRDLNKEMVPAKFEAYRALSCSSSIVVTPPDGIIVVKDCEIDFEEDVIQLDDFSEGEPKKEFVKNAKIHKVINDGFGLMLPSYAEQISIDLKLGYIPSGVNTRAYAYEKGMIVTFDYLEFANRISKEYMIKDAWGQIRDIRKSQVILTTSMLKLWDSYSSFEDYMANCKKNKYDFCVTKICPNILENERNLNYQFIQSYRLNDEQILQLIQPTIDEIKDVLGNDYRKTLLFLKGTEMNNENTKHIENDFVKALMINKNMINDPYVISKVHYMIKKRINEAKVGSVKVSGNFQIACGDPYALCQSIFGLKITGLLNKGEFYSKYWSDKNVNQVACFRAPMTCHNNIRKLNIISDEKKEYWYKYIKTMVIFNSFDTTADALNGEDFDSDQNFLSDNHILLDNIRPLNTIMCAQKKADKQIISEDALVQANIDSFGDDIGMYTNGITSQFDVQAQFEVGSKEYEELDYRIMCGQLFQQNAIDKTKGIISKPRPKNWFNYDENRIKENDSEEIKQKKEFNKKIVATKKPYFMKYIYPQTMKQYNSYIESSNQKCICQFNITLDELIKKPNKTTQEYDFIKYYNLRLPVGNNGCIVNKICWKFEEEFDNYLKSFKNIHNNFDYSILKSNEQYSNSTYLQIEKVYKEYCMEIQRYQQIVKRDRIKDEDANEQRKSFVYAFAMQCDIICPNEKKLANIVLDLCYKTNKSKQFAWDICGDVFIDNLLQSNNYTINYPEICEDGDIDFGGYKFKMISKQIGGFEENE